MALTLVVEDGTGKTNSNTYISLADAEIYFESRLNITDWSGETDANKNIALAQACRMLDQYVDWIGEPSNDSQALEWPRVNADYEANGVEVYVDSDEIPVLLKYAQCELAISLFSNNTQQPSGLNGFSSISIPGAIHLTVEGSGSQSVIPSVILRMVRYLGNTSSAAVELRRG